MSKIIEMRIDRCFDCPYMRWDDNERKYYCDKMPGMSFTYIDGIEFIPDWCPLEDAEDD